MTEKICEYCDKPMIECLKLFEVTAYDSQPLRVLADKHFSDINEAIDWARFIPECDYIEVFQGCDRNNRIYTQDIEA